MDPDLVLRVRNRHDGRDPRVRAVIPLAEAGDPTALRALGFWLRWFNSDKKPERRHQRRNFERIADKAILHAAMNPKDLDKKANPVI